MKSDLATAIVAAIAGTVVAYFVCNMIVSNFAKSTFTVNDVDSSIGDGLASPSPDVFNYKALNPTVEVYVGNCTEINVYGECVDESSAQIEEGIIEETPDNSQSSQSSTNQRNDTDGDAD